MNMQSRLDMLSKRVFIIPYFQGTTTVQTIPRVQFDSHKVTLHHPLGTSLQLGIYKGANKITTFRINFTVWVKNSQL